MLQRFPYILLSVSPNANILHNHGAVIQTDNDIGTTPRANDRSY